MKSKLYFTITLLAIVTVVNSCQTASNIAFGTNKSKVFASKEDYYNTNFNEKSVDTTKVVLLAPLEFSHFAQEIVEKHLSMYYGIADRDFISGDQLTIKSCSGQFTTLYRKVGVDDADLRKDKIELNPTLKALNLNPYNKTAIFIYSYKLGKLGNSRIFDIINELKHDPNFDYRIISLDNSDVLN